METYADPMSAAIAAGGDQDDGSDIEQWEIERHVTRGGRTQWGIRIAGESVSCGCASLFDAINAALALESEQSAAA